MAKTKFDGLIEAVRYTTDGKIELVRAYERRGAAFSDHILINRAQLVERLKKGEKFVTGQRTEFWGGTFEATTKSVSLAGDFISTSAANHRDLLEEVPVF
jgi:hypothetical protein